MAREIVRALLPEKELSWFTETPKNQRCNKGNLFWRGLSGLRRVKLVLQVLQKNRGDPEFVVPQETTGCEELIGHFFFSHYFTSFKEPFPYSFEFTP